MAKDPAFLFYPNDYLGGTTGMTLEEKGGYMELLVMQFNKGAFTKEQAKKLLNGHFEAIWEVLKEKFTEQDGKFFNERLEIERNKRNKFIAKQTKIGKTGGRPRKENNPEKTQPITQTKPNPFQKHNPNETILENENEIENINELEIGKVIQFVKITAQKLLTIHEVEDYWEAFKIHSKNKFYSDVGEKIEHFRNWLKKQDFKKLNNGISKTKHEGDTAMLHSLDTDLKIIAGGIKNYGT